MDTVKNFSGDGRSSRKLLEPSEKPKVICTDNSLDLGKKPCEDLSWNHCASTHHRSETNFVAKSGTQNRKKARLLCCYIPAWMKK